jgi:hypothetical protein
MQQGDAVPMISMTSSFCTERDLTSGHYSIPVEIPRVAAAHLTPRKSVLTRLTTSRSATRAKIQAAASTQSAHANKRPAVPVVVCEICKSNRIVCLLELRAEH